MNFAKVKDEKIIDVIVLNDEKINDPDYITTFATGCDMLVSIEGVVPGPRIGDGYVNHVFIPAPPPSDDNSNQEGDL